MPKKPIVLCTLSLDAGGGGTQNLSTKTINFNSTSYTARVLEYGKIDQSCAYPSGLIEIGDATVKLADTDGQIRTWIDAVTPLRRYATIGYGDEVSGDFTPLYSGQIVPNGVDGGPGFIIIKLQDTIKSWFKRPIPGLITRDNFPNLPDEIESAFAPIIFGENTSYNGTNYDPQGVINCVCVDTNANLYCVARHPCSAILNVYRKSQLGGKFSLVNTSEYTAPSGEGGTGAAKNINGTDYYFQYIQFTEPQAHATVIHCDVLGYPTYWDFTSNSELNDVENPADHIVTLIYYLLQNEIRLGPNQPSTGHGAFNADSMIAAHNYFLSTPVPYYSAGAITGDVNSKAEISAGLALSRICESFKMDIVQGADGLIHLNIFDLSTLPVSSFNATPDNICSDSFKPSFSDKTYNRIRYRYSRQPAELTEYTKTSHLGQWGWEAVIDDVTEQNELGAATGTNPLLEKVVEFHFIRDDHVAYYNALAMFPFYKMRSYLCEFDVPTPEVIGQVTVGGSIYVTHYQGIGSGGWSNRLFKIVGLSHNLKTYRTHFKCVSFEDITGDTFTTWPTTVGDHDSHDADAQFPLTPIVVNGEDTGEHASVTHNFNNTTPAVPAASLIPGSTLTTTYGFGESFTSNPGSGGGPGTITGIGGAYVTVANIPVIFQRSAALDGLINISAYVPNLAAIAAASGGPKIYVNTLGNIGTYSALLGSADAYRAIFYATDFDRMYWWTGAGWSAIAWDGGNIILRVTAPTGAYHLCDGSTVNMSTQSGGIVSTALKDLVTSSPLLVLGSSYVAPEETLVVTSDELPTCLEVPEYNSEVYGTVLMPYIRL